jgi:acetylornithine deacetylase/succinyl-diaminopimelate desuccinylase-like protein
MPDRPSDRRAMVEAACGQLDRERLRELLTGVVDIASPTGDEAPLAGYLATELARSGVEATTQPLTDRQANAVGRVRGDGTGPDLLLYAPIDTLTTGDPTRDAPLVAGGLRPDMLPQARVVGDHVIGLGAGNPKGHAACVLAAVEAVQRAGLPLRGDLVAGFGAGGMPTNSLDVAAGGRGQGAGCAFLLEQGYWTDFAVIAKPGWEVSWEEVGLCWFDLVVHGTHTYVGSRHRLPYHNPIVSAAAVVERVERWLADYPGRHAAGTLTPQGVIGAVHGGLARMPAVTPDHVRLRVDLRVTPETTPTRAKREVATLVADLAKELPDLSLSWEMVLAIPGTRTDPDAWVVRSAIAAWEAVEGRPHRPAGGTSGATDANILRTHGIPTARIGMPKVPEIPGWPTPVDFSLGMNVVDTRQAERLCRHLIQVAVDTTTRTLAEVGLER